MAGTLQLYTQENHEGLRSFPMGSFTTTNLALGTDYYENYKEEIHLQTLDKDVWAVKLSLNATATQNLTVDLAWTPIEEQTMVADENGYLVPSNCNLTAPLLTVRPTDWDLHWRDKYNQRKYDDSSPYSEDISRVYSTRPILAPTSGGTPYIPEFTSNTYAQTGQGRYLFWTMADIYFSVEAFWEFASEYSGGPKGVQYYLQPAYVGAETSYESAYVYSNAFRERGVSGPLVGNLVSQERLQIRMTDWHRGFGEANPAVHMNFINFNYDIELPNHEIQTKQFIGIVLWRAGYDGIPTSAQIVAFEKEFWEGTPEPPNDGPTSSPQGGHGTFSAPSDNRGDRNGTTAAAIATSWNSSAAAFGGGYNNYCLNPVGDIAAFHEMTERLWEGQNIFDAFANQMTNPLSSIICCHQIPANLAPTHTGTDKIKAATATLTSREVPTFNELITHWHGGSADISVYSDSFADFTNTSVYLHLPYIGTVQIDTAACMHGWLAVDYLCDITSGDCTALITTMDKFGNTEIRYEFKGNCGKKVPLQEREQLGQKITNAVLPTVIGLATAAITGSAVGGAAVSGAANNVMSGLDDYYGVDSGGFANPEDIGVVKTIIGDSLRGPAGRSGAIGAAAGTIGTSAATAALSGAGTTQSNAAGGNLTSPIDTQIWILITRPQWSAPELYARERAYPSDISHNIGEFQGFLSVSTCEINGIDCTDSELHEIDGWLKSGVLLD